MDPLEITKGTLRALASQVPVVGPLLTGAFAARAKEVQEARLQEFLEDLRAEFSRLLPADFDRQYLDSQDFAHLVLLAAEHAQRARRREKRMLYARALANAGTHEWAGRCDLVEELMDALADLSPTEVRVLQAAWEHRAAQPPAGQDGEALQGTVRAENIAPRLADLGLTEGEIRAYLGKLQRLGFTEEGTGALFDYAGGSFRLTPLLDRLTSFSVSIQRDGGRAPGCGQWRTALGTKPASTPPGATCTPPWTPSRLSRHGTRPY